jgi:hypothetical protein
MRISPVVMCIALSIVTLTASSGTFDVRASGEALVNNNGELELRGALEGSSHGTLRVTLRRHNDAVISGDWALTTVTEIADGVEIEAGAMSGRVDAGTVLTAEGGRLVSLSNLALTILDGSGDYAGVAEGNGRLDVRLGRESEPFQATVAFTF